MTYLKGIFQSVRLTFSMLKRQGLKEAIPVFLFLLLIMLLLAAINSFTPLVPFVYSLF